MRLFYFLLPFFFSFINANAAQYFPQNDPSLDAYLKRMPWELYEIYEVPMLGKFYVDDAQDVVKDTIKAGNLWETYIIDVLKKYVNPGDFVCDIGSHMGSITFALSHLVGENGKVFAFESERQFFRELVENIKLNQFSNIFPHLCWLGESNSTWERSGCYSKTYSLVDQSETEIYTLQKRTLDSFHLSNLALIKMDVECTEDQVLEGAVNTLMTSRPILVLEIMGGFGVNPSKETTQRINQTIHLLEKMNYTVSKIWIDDYLAIPNEKLL